VCGWRGGGIIDGIEGGGSAVWTVGSSNPGGSEKPPIEKARGGGPQVGAACLSADAVTSLPPHALPAPKPPHMQT
jgi:hypothetical protein